jgi:AcrR family transcriptional regulator
VRGTLSRERIAAQALDLIDRAGLEALSLRTLAAELGCEAMSLYRHVAHKDDLLDAVLDRLVGEWQIEPPHAGTPRERYVALCASYRLVARRHPLAFPLLAARRFNSAESLAVLERVLAVLQDAGLDGPARARAFRMTGYFLNGMGLAEGSVSGTGPMARAEVLVDAAPARFPVTRATARWLGPDGLDDAYDAGLDALMRAIFSPTERPASAKRRR